MKKLDYTSALGKIAWGYLLIHLDLKLGTLEILPNWLGLLLIYQALVVLGEHEPSAQLLKPFALFLTAYEGVFWLAAIFAYTPQLYPLDLLFSILSLHFHFQLLTMLASLAAQSNLHDSARSLLHLRNARTILMTLAFLPLPWARYGIALMVLSVINLLVGLFLCITVFSYRGAERQQTEAEEKP